MLSKDKLDRINELAKKAKAEGLSLNEQKEQKILREEYLEKFRGGMRNHIEGMKVVDQEGNDVTPDKLKGIQKEKGLHNRHKE
ncbi:DUF896 family protein [Vagococcus sp. BWB3-3]|uniref:UPF0291 protein I6N95_24325 n=1 Tax=Vagococcus allomyrinae TaxID=2794353 RepID=A0A940SY74_9ENTE|nr:DUF896 family protein [Vagococcus allomyrinae]MBP1044141.1 DUF896 family protein [Vagococcus allomyrinae]